MKYWQFLNKFKFLVSTGGVFALQEYLWGSWGNAWTYNPSTPLMHVYASVRSDVGFNVNGTAGFTGSFTEHTGKTVTVSGGIITNVA